MVSAMVIGPGKVNLSLRLVWARAALASSLWTGPLRRIGPVTVSVLPGREENIEFRLPAELAAG